MARWKNLSLHYRLQSMVVGIVVDFSINFVLDNLVLMGLDDLVRNSYDRSGQWTLCV